MKLVSDDAYLPACLSLLGRARKSIDIMAYSFAIGSASGRLDQKGAPFKIARKLADLKEKHGNKLNIRLYLEGERETVGRNRVTAKYLKNAGVQVKFGATHAKGICVDNREVLFGSTNFTNQSIQKNFETNLLFNDAAAVAGFEKYFTHLWRGGRHGGVELDPPMIADGGFKAALVEMIYTAKKRIEFSIYFFHQAEIEQALLRANARGVQVAGFIHTHRMFALSYVRRTQSTVRRLREGGIKDLTFGPSHLFSHSKYLIRDRKELALGTGNWLDEDVEIHPQLYIRVEDAALARKLAKILATQIADHCP